VTSDDAAQRKVLLERLAASDTAMLERLVALLDHARESPADSGSGYLGYLRTVAESDVRGLRNAERSYGNSWKRRGGVDTFNMLARKWDRVEKRLATSIEAGVGMPGVSPYDIFEHIAVDTKSDGFIDDVRDLRRYLMLTEAEIAARRAGNVEDSGRGYLDQLSAIADADVANIEEKERAYGSSWKRRGGIGAFMMFARKFDRIEQRVSTEIPAAAGAPGAQRHNLFQHIVADRRAEGLLEDIRDLRRYLILVEAEMAARGATEIGTARDDREQS
jgi:hypothetical protein